ncbi:cobalt ABC transporter ATP-binding protein [Flavonifractor sp. An135]|nr:ATP-binding cassette domain-containing protein [Flavonifractor sp. An135]OUQ22052.1 cobalt ABC transporter ATP-binding protein [Flavonifractor sp. An135]
MNAVEIDSLTYTYPGASQPTLNGISLRIEQGDFLAVVGNNGCGKSTLCKVLNGLIPHFITGQFEGAVRVEGQDTLESDVGALARKVGYVYQDFENQIVRPTVLDDASYACLNYALPDYRERGREALRQCGLEGREEEYVWQLSGGQTHLLALAGAVSLRPDVLILDEPIAQLDPMHADRIYEVLRALNEEQGKTIIVIEHHTEYIADYCKHVLLMKDGQVQWHLPTREALQRVEELEACNIFPPQVTQAAHRLRAMGALPAGAPLPTTVEEGKRAFAALKLHPQGAAPAAERAGETAVSLKQVSLSYRSVKGEPRTIFDGLDLDIRRGERVALIGSNGAGKSTLMKLMVGLLKPKSGTVSLFGANIGEKRAEDLSRQISLVYQNPEEMFIKDSVRADIAYAMQVRGVPDWETRTDALLERFRLTGLQDRDGRLLSGGQMRRGSLAIGVALEPGILLLDEPTANLDIATRREILGVLEDMQDLIQTAIIATHDMQLVCQWAQRIIVLCGGKVVADGSRDEIFARPELAGQVGIRPPEIFTMARALNPDARCYTIDAFTRCFGEA